MRNGYLIDWGRNENLEKWLGLVFVRVWCGAAGRGRGGGGGGRFFYRLKRQRAFKQCCLRTHISTYALLLLLLSVRITQHCDSAQNQVWKYFLPFFKKLFIFPKLFLTTVNNNNAATTSTTTAITITTTMITTVLIKQ